jgi:predicted outer membrane repeat protein
MIDDSLRIVFSENSAPHQLSKGGSIRTIGDSKLGNICTRGGNFYIAIYVAYNNVRDTVKYA